jgi:AcrR family transcriptional regulator
MIWQINRHNVKGLRKALPAEVCRRADTSKAALYREFLGEDQLLAEALALYFDRVLTPAYQLLETYGPAPEVLGAFVDMVMTDRDAAGMPKGCLLTKLRHSQMNAGPKLSRRIQVSEAALISRWQAFIERGIADGTIATDLTPNLLATYLEAQISLAMWRQSRGCDDNTTREVLQIGLAAILPSANQHVSLRN